MVLTLAGLPLLIVLVGSLVVSAAPVWLAARIVGADNPTLLRSILALLLASVLAGICLTVAGPLSLLLVPLAFVFSYMWVLGASFGQALLLGILSLLGYFAMASLFGDAAMTHFGHGVPAERV